MKLAAPLLSLLWLSACSFPEFDLPSANGNGGGSGPAGPTCSDAERNGDESGIDCGMLACGRACPVGQGCDGDADCESGKCEDSTCRAPRCDDSVQNSDETDVDCGGESGCRACEVGKLCRVAEDCNGGACLRGSCQEPSCRDGIRNLDESDVDCGGGCSPCDVGKSCNATGDCDGVACVKSLCQAAACGDGVWNQDETDLDCGGSCGTRCADDARCTIAEDCVSLVCANATRRCAAARCDDMVRNGDEPSVDCGKSCSNKCMLLDPCSVGDDCATGSCSYDVCVPSAATGQALSPLNWIASASNTFGSSDPKYAIDGIKNTDWTTGALQQPGMWFTIDMQSKQVFFSIEIDCTNTRDDSPAAVNVSFSNDGSFSDPPVKENVKGEDQMVFTFSKAQVARYIRISLAQGAEHWWRLDELRVKQ